MPNNDPVTPRMPAAAIGMHALALALIFAAVAWGIQLAVSLAQPGAALASSPDTSGRPDIGFGFVALAFAAPLCLIFLGAHLAARRNPALLPVERRCLDLTHSYANLALAGVLVSAGLSRWYGLELGGHYFVACLVAFAAIFAISTYYFPVIVEERAALTTPADPSLDPRHWVLMGLFYLNSQDSRPFVPRPPHTGLGFTPNLATPLGVLAVFAFVVYVGTGMLRFLK